MRLEAMDVSFRYQSGAPRILNRVSLTVEAGERVGLTGPSGLGKTTLCKLLAGYERPEEGKILLDGKPLREYKGRLPVQMIWQHPEQSVNPRWRMGQVLREGGWQPGQMFPCGDPSGNRSAENGAQAAGRHRAAQGADFPVRLGIRPEWLDRFPAELSGGELQRFCIARALGEGTEILIADEITTMLDLVTQEEIWNALLEEAERRKLGMVIVSHSETLLKKVCTRRVELTQEYREDGHGRKRDAESRADGDAVG